MGFAKKASYSVGCLSTFLVVSFEVQKGLNFDNVQVIFLLLLLLLGSF